jgi:hypothetical protein
MGPTKAKSRIGEDNQTTNPTVDDGPSHVEKHGFVKSISLALPLAMQLCLALPPPQACVVCMKLSLL